MTREEILNAAQQALLQGELQQAECLFEDVLREEPGNLRALDGMGIVRCQLDDSESGIAFFREAIRLASGNPSSEGAATRGTLSFHLALALHAVGERDEAIDMLKQSVELVPNEPDVLLNLGQLCFERERYEEAIECFQALTACRPDNASAWLTLGYILSLQERYDDAIPVLTEAVRLDASSPEACFYLAEAFRLAERFEESLPLYQRMFPVAAEWPQAVYGYGKSLLALGRLEDGWDAMEFRLASSFGSWKRHFLPNWSGVVSRQDDGGKDERDQTVLAYSEEGIAAEILFASCLPDLINSVERCVVECETSLHGLFQRSFPRATIVPLTREDVGIPDPASEPSADERTKNSWGLSLDRQIAFGSLPRHFRRHVEDFPIRKAYLVPDRDRVEQWSNRLAEIGGVPKIGVLWHGSWTAEKERQTTLPLPELHAMILRHQGDAAWICLQHGSKQKEIEQYRRHASPRIHLFKEVFRYDLDEMAALVNALDLVVTPPGYIAHLAGALGVKTWLILPARSDWRWNLGKEGSLWHPSMTVYRQQNGQAWPDLFGRLEGDLRHFLTTHKPPEEEIPSTLAFPGLHEQSSQPIRRMA